MPNFKKIEAKDNFYQSTIFYPMPVVLITTISESGQTNIGPYSLVFPYYVAGKNYYAMLLECRNSSNTAQNILRTKKCSLCFIPDDSKYFKEAVQLGWPGDTTKEKMQSCKFSLVDSPNGEKLPKIVDESFQVLECTWDDTLENASKDKPGKLDGYEGPFHNFNGITSTFGAHFILKIDNILMEEKYRNSIVNGATRNNFPKVPVDYGYRDSKYFWCSKHVKPKAEAIPPREVDVSAVRYAANRLQTGVKFSDDALAMLVKVPRVFLTTILKACVKWADENNIKLITEKEMKVINDKRSKEKKEKK